MLNELVASQVEFLRSVIWKKRRFVEVAYADYIWKVGQWVIMACR